MEQSAYHFSTGKQAWDGAPINAHHLQQIPPRTIKASLINLDCFTIILLRQGYGGQAALLRRQFTSIEFLEPLINVNER